MTIAKAKRSLRAKKRLVFAKADFLYTSKFWYRESYLALKVGFGNSSYFLIISTYAKIMKLMVPTKVRRAKTKSTISVPESKLVILRAYHMEMLVIRYVCMSARKTELNISFC